MVAEIIVSAESGVGNIRIDRPAKKNALSTTMYQAMADALETFDRDDAVRVATIRGGADFTAGNDLRDFLAAISGEEAVLNAIVEFLTRLADFSKPLIAAVRGNAIGIGTTMLLHADVVVAGRSAQFRLPFTQLGLVAEAGSSLLLPLVAGRMRACWMLLAGEFFSADEAFAAGLVTKLVGDERVDATADAIAANLAALPPIALRETKRLMREAIAKEVRGQMDAEFSALSERLKSDEFRTSIEKSLSRL